MYDRQQARFQVITAEEPKKRLTKSTRDLNPTCLCFPRAPNHKSGVLVLGQKNKAALIKISKPS
ncbi:hypothetical protein AN958_02473 [Leucoagaricus sp. SymC.cos]|nr:hypothetical protein AN958_02473 [Leucoagaricus sp. SymC.cos]